MPPSQPPAPVRRWRMLLIVGLSVLGLGGLGMLIWFVCCADARVPAPPDPRLTIDTPFLNVRPDVGYIGDEACARCHATIVEDYRQHSMGRSLAPVATAPPVELYTEAAHNPFELGPLRYTVERKGERMVHREQCVRDGRAVTDYATDVHVALGSGDRARSYLINKDGFVFQSAITWFGQGQRWNQSPGFQKDNPHFSRLVTPQCLFCHTNHATPVEHTSNRYHEPIFRGDGIGCERCHGPGALHEERRIWRNGIDVTIVNPKHLQPATREAVCEQCHMQGAWRVVRRGREDFDYRPGLPLQDFIATYVEPQEEVRGKHFVGQVDQFHASTCYQQSAGKMGCTTCHDPHRLPLKEERVGFYRQRCLTCHETKPCTEPVAKRRTVTAEDSCIQCHMPAVPSPVQHTAITDHHIRRVPDGTQPTEPDSFAGGAFKVFELYDPEGIKPAGPEVDRDYAIAVAETSDIAGLRSLRVSPEKRKAVWKHLLPLAELAARRDPEDWPAREAQAGFLWMASRAEEAAAIYEEILRKAPQREKSLVAAAVLAQERGRRQEAAELWRRACAASPYHWGYHLQLGATLAEDQRDWQAALEPLRTTLRLNPMCFPARKLLVACLLEVGDRAQADAEFRVLVDLNPSDLKDVQRWYEERSAGLR